MVTKMRSIAAVAFLPLLLGGCVVTAWKSVESGINTIVNNITAFVNCWSCGIVEHLFMIVEEIIEETVPSLQSGALGLLSAGYGIWLVMLVLKSFKGMAFGAPGLDKDFWTEFNSRFLCVMFAAILIGNAANITWLLESSVFLIVQMFVNLAQAIVMAVMETVSIKTGEGQGAVIKSAVDNLNVCPLVTEVSLGGLKESMLCLLRSMHQLMMTGVGIGFRFMMENAAWSMIIGGVFIFMFLFYSVAFPFYVMDAVFRMAFMLALVPLFVTAWAFPSTRKYAKTAFDSFIGTGVQLAFITMYMTFSTVLLFNHINNNEALREIYDPKMIETLESNATETLSSFNSTGTKAEEPILVLLVLAFYMFRLSGKVVDLAAKFAGTLGPNIFQGMMTALIGILKNMAFMALSAVVPGAHLIKAGVQAAIGKSKGKGKGKDDSKQNSPSPGTRSYPGGSNNSGSGGGNGGAGQQQALPAHASGTSPISPQALPAGTPQLALPEHASGSRQSDGGSSNDNDSGSTP